MKNEITAIGAFAVLTFVHPHAAIGAMAGVCFFLAMPQNIEWWRLVLLSIVSGFMGYGAGVTEWGTSNAMLVSSIVSALGVAFLTSMKGVIKDRVMDIINLIVTWRK